MTHCFNNKITSVYLKGVLFWLKSKEMLELLPHSREIVSGVFCVRGCFCELKGGKKEKKTDREGGKETDRQPEGLHRFQLSLL